MIKMVVYNLAVSMVHNSQLERELRARTELTEPFCDMSN